MIPALPVRKYCAMDPPPVLVVEGFSNQSADVVADRLAGGISEDRLGRRIHEHHHPTRIECDDAVDERVHEGSQEAPLAVPLPPKRLDPALGVTHHAADPEAGTR